jgi:hypothetical protein
MGMNTDPRWQVEKQEYATHFFSLTTPEGENVLFVFSNL